MVIAIAFLIVLAAIGGGIYLWVKRQRKNLLKKKTELAQSSKVLVPREASLLDTFASPVSNTPARSTDGERPQINASPDTTAGEGAEHLDEAAEKAKAAAEVEDTKYVASFRQAAPSINDLAEKLMAAWDEATTAYNAEDRNWDLVGESRRTIYLGNDCRFFGNSGDASKFVKDLNAHFAGGLSNYKHWLATSAEVNPKAQAAGAAFEALRLALKPFEEHRSDLLPVDLCVLCQTAHKLLKVSRESIEKLLKSAQETLQKVEKEVLAGKPLKREKLEKLFTGDAKTFVEGTHADDQRDTLEAREAFVGAMIAAIEEQLKCSNGTSAVQQVFAKLEEIGKRTFTYPQKPTPEEIVRFLTEVELWSVEKLECERQVAPLIAQADQGIKALKDAVKALKRSRGRTTPVLTDANRTIDEGLILAANKVVSDLETAIESAAAELSKSVEKQPKVDEPVLTATAEEEATTKLLRADARKVAFALAQRAVASTKLAQIQRLEPSLEGMPPRIDRTDGFAKYRAQYQTYFDRRAQKQAAYSKWAEGRDVVQMAYDARKAKVTEVSQALSSKMAGVQKTSTTKTANELLVVGGMATKIVQLIGS